MSIVQSGNGLSVVLYLNSIDGYANLRWSKKWDQSKTRVVGHARRKNVGTVTGEGHGSYTCNKLGNWQLNMGIVSWMGNKRGTHELNMGIMSWTLVKQERHVGMNCWLLVEQGRCMGMRHWSKNGSWTWDWRGWLLAKQERCVGIDCGIKKGVGRWDKRGA